MGFSGPILNSLPAGFVLTSPVINTGFTVTPQSWATIGATAPATDTYAFASDFGHDGGLLRYNGTRWKPLNGSLVLASLDTAPGGVGSVEAIAFQYQLPINALQNKDRLRLALTMTKSGTTDAGTLRFRMGTAGTTGDTQIYSQNAMIAANQVIDMIVDFRLESATSIQMLGASGGAAPGYSGTSGNAAIAPTTISSASANAVFFSVGILSAGVTNTVTLLDATLTMISTAN